MVGGLRRCYPSVKVTWLGCCSASEWVVTSADCGLDLLPALQAQIVCLQKRNLEVPAGLTYGKTPRAFANLLPQVA